MKTNVKEFLKQAVEFQEFAEKRGYELLMALGCKWKMYEHSDNFEFELDGVTMRFQENTRHDCPDYETICLKDDELMLNEPDWNLYIENAKEKTSIKLETERQAEVDRRIQAKEDEFERLKKELNK